MLHFAYQYAIASSASFNTTKCPAYWELQAPTIPANFTLNELPGQYYELALHDLTQYPICPTLPRCVTSNKTIRTHPDGVIYVHDAWNLDCVGGVYPETLLFNVTNEPGYFIAYTTLFKDVIFPDTVVAFKPGPSGWVLEFQCVEKNGAVDFVGINFYAKNRTSETAYDEMYAAGKARGIDFYWNRGLGLTRVNQSGCSEAAVPASARAVNDKFRHPERREDDPPRWSQYEHFREGY